MFKNKVSLGYGRGITGPNAALTVGIDWDTSLKHFDVITVPYDGMSNSLVALVPKSEFSGAGQFIVDAINQKIDNDSGR